MKLPRDVGGATFSRLLAKHFAYNPLRQVGSHLRMVSTYMGEEHHITIPLHDPLKVGTLNALLAEVAAYLKIDKKRLLETLFGK